MNTKTKAADEGSAVTETITDIDTDASENGQVDEDTGRDVYTMDETGTYKNGALIANFSLKIIGIQEVYDEDRLIRIDYEIGALLKGKRHNFVMDFRDFTGSSLLQIIQKELGPRAILYGSPKDLIIASQENSKEEITETRISMCTGFTPDHSKFLLPNMSISADGIDTTSGNVVDLSGAHLAQKIGFQELKSAELEFLIKHLFMDFIKLKSPGVMFPLLGHIAIAPFSSLIVEKLSRQKYTLHLKGPSGGGKSFIAALVGSFFGDFGEQLTSWSSTGNALETDGYHFRDLLFIVDDYKGSTTLKKDVIRVIQNCADNRGRGRLTSSLKHQKTPCIRGLLLSTGEDFINDVESVMGRTIVVDVEPEHNQEAGEACKRMRHLYNGFVPVFVQWILSQDGWQDQLASDIQNKIDMFSSSLTEISNGLRIATNWALNFTGFELFCRFSNAVDVITKRRCSAMLNEYQVIAEKQFAEAVQALKAQNPTGIFWTVLEHKLATEEVVVEGLIARSRDTTEKTSTVLNKKIIGKVSEDKGSVYLFPAAVMKHMARHFKDLGEMLPFDKAHFRDALVRAGHIRRAGNNRITKQVRHNGGRVQAWQFDLADFKAHCINADEE